MTANYPLNTWYVAATTEELGHRPFARALLDRPVVLFRTKDAQAVALADRCAHRGYPLSKGKVVDDRVVCQYHGFEYDTSGTCVRVPSQPNPPYGAAVASYPIHEIDGFVWIWLGDPRLSHLQPVPSLPWLGDGWAFTGTTMGVYANYLRVHDHYLDLTHIPYVHPQETPPDMNAVPPLDRIEVSESTVTFSRALPPAGLADWEAEATGLARDRTYERRHYGTFISPAVLAEGWEIDGGQGTTYAQVRIQAVTPESPSSTHLFWKFARNYALDDTAVGAGLHGVFENVLRTDVNVIETVEAASDPAQPAGDIKVVADAGVLKVRQIIDTMLARESR